MSQGSIPFGKYRLVAALGRGGTAEVFLALSRGSHGFEKLVVIKRLRTEVAAEDSYKTILMNEARLAARLSHPNIVQTHEVGEHEDHPFLAMEYLDGQPLNRVIAPSRRGGPRLPVSFAVRIAADALAGLHYAHELQDFDGRPLNIVHRDVSPHNVFVTYEGEVKLVDFGIAKTSFDQEVTEVGVLKGKIAYMAPEQALGERVDGRADVFAVGAILFEMLTGRRLFEGDHAPELLRRVLACEVPRVSELVPCDPVLEAICMRALARSPDDRWPTADAMREELEAWLRAHGGYRRDDVRREMQQTFARLREHTQHRIRGLVQAARVEVDATGELPVVGGGSRPSLISSSSDLEGTPTTAMPSARAQTEMGAALTSDEPRRSPRRLLFTLLGTASIGAIALLSARPWRRASPPPAAVAPPPIPVALRLCGSNTIGESLAPALVEAFLRKRGVGFRREKGERAHETHVVSSNGDHWVVEAEGSATAFTGLAAGSCDVGMSSRPIREDEARRSTGLSEHVVALDGIAVIAHPNLPRRSLAIDELARIFSGEITDWSTLGAPAGSITVHARDDRSGTWDTFAHLVLGKRKLATTARRWVESNELSSAVAADANAVGFIGLAFVGSAKPLAIGDKGTIPSLPSVFTVTTETYPLSRRLYFYLPAKPTRTAALELTTFALSPEGQQVVRDTGFVDLTIDARESDSCAGCSARYLQAVKGARRLSLDFHFRPGTDQLDSRGLRDLDRLVTYLRAHVGHLRLLGFEGAPVQLVAEELAARGVKAARVVALGSEMPVASGDTPEGRLRNQRVEVWLE